LSETFTIFSSYGPPRCEYRYSVIVRVGVEKRVNFENMKEGIYVGIGKM
jgi:hypothetical protein